MIATFLSKSLKKKKTDDDDDDSEEEEVYWIFAWNFVWKWADKLLLACCLMCAMVDGLSFDGHKRCTSIYSIEEKDERKKEKKIGRAHTSQLDRISQPFIESIWSGGYFYFYSLQLSHDAFGSGFS